MIWKRALNALENEQTYHGNILPSAKHADWFRAFSSVVLTNILGQAMDYSRDFTRTGYHCLLWQFCAPLESARDARPDLLDAGA